MDIRLDSQTSKKIDELIKANKHIIFKTTAQRIGVGADEVKVPQHPRDGHFSKALSNAGMTKFEGLNTICDHERYMDKSKQWMEKLN